MPVIPRIISVDDHVVEPPDLWTARIGGKFADRAPKVVRDTAKFSFKGGVFSFEKGVDGGELCDWWLYDDLVYPFPKLSAAVGFDELDVTPVTFDEIRPGCWKQKDRLADMDANHVEASICFPNTLPRFCGQTFYEQVKKGGDADLALLCVQAYNDWMIDEWCAGDAKGRLIPLTMVPLWDAELCAAEVRRCADKGSFAIAFSENPHPLGLPSVHDKDRFWDPLFTACQETETVVCMHIGSSSRMPATSPDAPFIVSSTLTFSNAMGSMLDYIFSGTLERFPTLKLAYSEGQVGWMPYVLERADKLWAERSDNSFGTSLPKRPSEYLPGRVYGCIFDDEVGLKNRDAIGMDQICFETDYPHADSTFPRSKEVAEEICEPHRGHEVAYNRWYERDHFYAGCMVGPWLFAGRRFVATRALKDLRFGSSPDVFGGQDLGSYLAVYWILDGRHDDHVDWALRQVKWLHAHGRMFPERDHIHTLMYRHTWTAGAGDNVPAELALDHPFGGLTATLVELDDGVTPADLGDWVASTCLPELELGFTPIPLADDAPVTQVGLDRLDRRVMNLSFTSDSPDAWWDEQRDAAAQLERAGIGRMLWTAPFVPTIPGTDTYTDELW
jgi:predicted TIM-barrel fold metal-dependent hydrolase